MRMLNRMLFTSWLTRFYYGAYQRKVNISGIEYPMDYAYIGTIIAMFVFQVWGTLQFESLV
jgi:hypothetical protein